MDIESPASPAAATTDDSSQATPGEYKTTRDAAVDANPVPNAPELDPKPGARVVAEPSPHSKPCDLCHRRRDVLIRCQIDETKKWHFVCTGKCWQDVSGGQADGDEDHRDYRYGGMWKNKHAYVSAKIKGKAKETNRDIWNGTPGPHRRHGAKAKQKRMGKHTGQVVITDDDGGSDIEVSDLEEGDVGRADVEHETHITLKEAESGNG